MESISAAAARSDIEHHVYNTAHIPSCAVDHPVWPGTNGMIKVHSASIRRHANHGTVETHRNVVAKVFAGFGQRIYGWRRLTVEQQSVHIEHHPGLQRMYSSKTANEKSRKLKDIHPLHVIKHNKKRLFQACYPEEASELGRPL